MSVSKGEAEIYFKLSKYEEVQSLASKYCSYMYRHGQAYLFPSEYVSGQFDHSKVSTAQRLVQVIQPGNLPIMMPFEPRHGCCWAGREELPSGACRSPVSSPSPPV